MKLGTMNSPNLPFGSRLTPFVADGPLAEQAFAGGEIDFGP